MSLEELQAVIDASLQRASPLTRRLFAESEMDAAAARDFVNETKSVTIATVRASGEPHASLTLIACSNDGGLYFAVNRESVLFRNLQRSQSIALTVDNAVHGIMAQGRAELVGEARELRDSLIRKLEALTLDGRWTPEGWEGMLYRIQLDRIFIK